MTGDAVRQRARHGRTHREVIVIVMQVIFEAFSDKRDRFVAASQRAMLESTREPGCVLYRFTADMQSPERFYLHEIWQDEDSLKRHLQGDVFRSFFEQLIGVGKPAGFQGWHGPLSPYHPRGAAGDAAGPGR